MEAGGRLLCGWQTVRTGSFGGEAYGGGSWAAKEPKGVNKDDVEADVDEEGEHADQHGRDHDAAGLEQLCGDHLPDHGP
jgi:hypothetical protein